MEKSQLPFSLTAHAVVVKSLAELITDDEEHGLRVWQFLRDKTRRR